MKDGIIKADGTSRRVKATFPATYEEFRAQAAAGTLSLDVLFQAAGWSQQPTFLSKANLLQDFVTARFGMDANAVPNDVFDFLGKLNEHWWQRRVNASRWEPELLEPEGRVVSYYNYATGNFEIEYSNNVAFDSLGNPYLVNAATLVGTNSTDPTYLNVLSGQFIKATKNSATSDVLYVPSGTADYTIRSTEDGLNISFTCSLVESIYTREVGDWVLLHSESEDAYPHNAVENGCEYEYLGIPYDNAKLAPRVETGSYVGTGTLGADNPTTLTFPSRPMLVLIKAVGNPELFLWLDQEGDESIDGTHGYAAINAAYAANNAYGYRASRDKNTLKLYSSVGGAAKEQANQAGIKYHYFAICR